MGVALVTLPHKCAVKGMKLVMINHDTREGEKRWTSVGRELSSCLSRDMGVLKSIASNWGSLPVTGTSLHLLLPACMNILIFILATFQNTHWLVLTYIV